MLKKLLFTAFVLLVDFVHCQDTSHLPTCTSQLGGQHFPSGFDCEHYFTCFNGEWVLQLCSSDPWNWFQRTTQECEFPQNVRDCEFAPATQPPTTQQPTTQPPLTTVQPPVTTILPITTLTPTTPSPNNVECSATGVSKVVNPFSCTRYWLCFDGISVEKSCSPGLFFSRSQLRCVRRDDSDCLLDNNSCPLENDPNQITFLPDQEDCQMYFICYDGQPVEFDCGPSLHFDPNNNWCIREEESECEPSYPLPPIREVECPEDTESDILFLPHPEDCQFYFICINGESTLVRCARNMLFDYVIEKCFFAESARCFNRFPGFLSLK